MLFSIGSIYVVKSRHTDGQDRQGRDRPKLGNLPMAVTSGPIQEGTLSISARATAGALQH